MNAGRRIVAAAGVLLLLLGAVFGCSLLLRDEAQQTGWYIRLNIAAPTASRTINVTEHDVTTLIVRVYDPDDQLLETIDWQPAQGLRSYLVPVSQVGQHRIEVTHIGEDNGTAVQAQESALFTIQAMRITVIDIVPGAIGVIQIEPGEPLPPLDLTGYWDVYMIAGGEEFGPDVFYILQTGSVLDCARGFTGSISGSTVTMEGWIEGSHVVGTGTVSASGNEIMVTMSGIPYVPWDEVTMRMVRPATAPFGRLDLEGTYLGEPISLHSDFGIGSILWFDDVSTTFRVFYLNNRLEVQVWFSIDGDIPVGEELTTPDQLGISLWWLDDDGLTLEDPEPADGPGTLTLTRYDDSGIAGSFSMSFLGGGAIEGSFDVGWLPGLF